MKIKSISKIRSFAWISLALSIVGILVRLALHREPLYFVGLLKDSKYYTKDGGHTEITVQSSFGENYMTLRGIHYFSKGDSVFAETTISAFVDFRHVRVGNKSCLTDER